MKSKERTLSFPPQLRDHGKTMVGHMASAGHSGDHIYQAKKKTCMSVKEMIATKINVTIIMLFVINKFNRESNNKYNFHMVQVLELQKQTADYM